MNLKKLLFAAVIVLSANASFAQLLPNEASHSVNISIPDFALLDIKSTELTNDITLVGTAPTVAGEAMKFLDATATNSDLWLNYSSIPKGGAERKVFVKILTGAVPTGLKLSVEAAASTSGGGKRGEVLGEIALTGVDAPIISGIKSAFTGNGSGQGHNLTYKLGYATANAADNYEVLNDAAVPQLTIMYTLSDIQ